MIVDPSSEARAQLALEKSAQRASKRDKYLKERLSQIRGWFLFGWALWVVLAIGAIWIYQQKPVYLSPNLLASQIQLGAIPSDEVAQLAALGGLMFWGLVVMIAGFIFQIYVAMYSERKLIRLFEILHREDMAKHQPDAADADAASADQAKTDRELGQKN